MKLKPWDVAFSRAVRESYFWTCAMCGLEDTEAQYRGKSRVMQNAHVISRKYKNIRCHPPNAVCLCASCHAKMTDAPTEWGLWVIKHMGEPAYEMLLERWNDHRIKYSKADLDDIAVHYRQEYQRLVKKRMNEGVQGYLELIAYD